MLGRPAAQSLSISATNCNAAWGPKASSWLKSVPPVSRCNGVRMSKRGSCRFGAVVCRAGGSSVGDGGCWAARVSSSASRAASHSAICCRLNW